MKRYLMWSGGKDSTASLILCYENGIHLDGVIFSEVMFDHNRNISAENPKFIKWVYDVAIPKIKEMGYDVIVVRSEKDYLHYFHKVYEKSKKGRNGLKYGFPVAGACWANSRLKCSGIKKWETQQKKIGEFEEIVGIAYDEPKRYENALKRGQRSVLYEFGILMKDNFAICEKYGLLSPTYADRSRSGCWFCPNESIKEFSQLRQEYPHLWNEIVQLSKTENLYCYVFRFGKTVEQIEHEMNQYEQNEALRKSQMTLF